MTLILAWIESLQQTRHETVRNGHLLAQRPARAHLRSPLSFLHAADRASTLLAAAAAFRRLADAVEVMVAQGGRLSTVDDGLMHVAYGRPV